MWNSVLSFFYILFVSSLLKPHLSLALPFHIPEKELKHVFQTDHTDYLIYQDTRITNRKLSYRKNNTSHATSSLALGWQILLLTLNCF